MFKIPIISLKGTPNAVIDPCFWAPVRDMDMTHDPSRPPALRPGRKFESAPGQRAAQIP